MNSAVNYPGRDLESMSFAENYHRWILDEFRPFLGSRIVEVGAGTGSFSELLVRNIGADELCLVEPSEMYHSLESNPAFQNADNTNLSFFNGLFQDNAAEIRHRVQPDSIMYVNVLEHIEDDKNELSLVHDALQPGGRCFIFVPALSLLFGAFDKKIGHFRRYKKRELENKCKELGFRILKSQYVDALGIIPWFIKYRLLGSDDLEPRAVSFYDRFAVPLVKRVEQFLPMPIGKNILLVVEK